MVPRVGDEVIVSCEPATARVVEKHRYITVEWPWGTADNSFNIRWSGHVNLPYGDAHQEWSPYRLEPAAFALRVGDVCTVSIPPTRLHVGHYETYDPPRHLGWAPAPTAGIYVIPPERMDLDLEDAGCMLYLGGAEPIRVEPVKD
ncbi:hypothetical protein OG539_40295 [Actinacidiphila glaucinigra]|uniref:hypothetical protein n=1 Tax=Actinacidiphila glaucinigra TaxID=235986 RepID=UPI00324B73FB